MDLVALVNEPKTKRGEQTLNKICESAEKLFYEKGFHNTSINDITDGANIAPGTFYIYFSDKLSLYRYLLLKFSHEIRKSISLATKDCKTRYEAEFIGLKTYLNYIKDHKNVYRIIWESLYIDFNLFKDYYESFANRYIRGLTKSLENNEVKPHDSMSTAYALMGISTFIGLKYVIFEDEVPNDDIIENVMSLLKEGLFT